MQTDLHYVEKSCEASSGDSRKFTNAWIEIEEAFPTFFSLDKSQSDTRDGIFCRAVYPRENRQIFIICEEIDGGWFEGDKNRLVGELLEFSDVLVLHPVLFDRIPREFHVEHLGKKDVKFYDYNENRSFSEEWDVIEVL